MTHQEGQIVEAHETSVDTSAEKLIELAITHNASVDSLERLMALRDKLKAERDKEAFFVALSELQSEMPPIQKKKAGATTRRGTIAYRYAPLGDIIEQVKEPLKRHGFSYRFETKEDGSSIIVTCFVHHKAGHTETTSMRSEMTNRTDVMSAPQQVGSTVTYLKRYSFCNAFGITTADEDDDGQSASTPQTPKTSTSEGKFVEATEWQIDKIRGLLAELGDVEEGLKKIYDAYKVNSLKEVNINDAAKIKLTLEKRVKDKGASMSGSAIKCYECNEPIKEGQAFKKYFCSEAHSKVWTDRNYGPEKTEAWAKGKEGAK